MEILVTDRDHRRIKWNFQTWKNKETMKYLLLVLLPIFSYAQQDSVVYEKRDSVWFKLTYSTETTDLGTKKVLTEDPYTKVDSLVKLSLIRELQDRARQYNQWKTKAEETEKDYLLKLRQADRQYRTLYTTRPNLDSLSNSKQLIGTWLLDGVEISITKQLKLLTASINFVSEDVFWVTNSGREYFFKRGKNWISDKRKLKPKTTRNIK